MRSSSLVTALSLIFVGIGGIPAFGQADDCAGGVVHDDGTYENAYGSGSFLFAHYVMRIEPPEYPAQLEALCICWTRTSADSSINFEIQVWDSDGADGAPGTFLGSIGTLIADMVPQTGTPPPLISQFYRYDLSTLGISSSRPLYAGPVWDSGAEADFFLCADENGPTTQPAYEDIGLLAGSRPPPTPLGTASNFPNYRNLGLRAVTSVPPNVSLSDFAGLIVPGFEVAVDEPEGTTTLFSVRNTTDDPVDVEIAYYGRRITEEPLRTDPVTLEAQRTRSFSVRNDLTGLPVEDGVAGGLILINEVGGPTRAAANLAGDYFQIDFANDFAGGDRLVRPAELCSLQEIRFVDFGDGAKFRVLLDTPQGDFLPSFEYTVYDESGSLLALGTHFTSDHLNLISVEDLSVATDFGSVVFDFSAAGGGWVSARYSAFGRFSVDLRSDCRDP